MIKIDLNCTDNKCLICNSELGIPVSLDNKVSGKECLNQCISLYFIYDELRYITIFGKVYVIIKPNNVEVIQTVITDWKEDDKYIAKILEGVN